MKKLSAILLLVVVTLALASGCASWVAPQQVAVPVQNADGTISTNLIPVEQLTPEVVAALQSQTALLPPPWNTIASVALGAGVTAFGAYMMNKRKNGGS